MTCCRAVFVSLGDEVSHGQQFLTRSDEESYVPTGVRQRRDSEVDDFMTWFNICLFGVLQAKTLPMTANMR